MPSGATRARRAAAAGARLGGAFTLIELLVVIAVILILASLVSTAVRNGLRQSQRAACTSNLKQWSAALTLYAGANQRFFPDNLGGMHCSWVSVTVKRFTETYLIPMGEFGGAERMRADHVIHCPTQQWHRVYGSPGGPGGTGYTMGLVGYFYLPHRDVNSCDYTYAGNEWVAKTKITSPPVTTPIMMDMKQYMDNDQGWFWEGVPYSSHIRRSGEPYGGNFLFADGRIQWYPSSEVELGATIGGWRCYYKIDVK